MGHGNNLNLIDNQVHTFKIHTTNIMEQMELMKLLIPRKEDRALQAIQLSIIGLMEKVLG
jgi:hypothetical protein